jgi:hypothetical protein
MAKQRSDSYPVATPEHTIYRISLTIVLSILRQDDIGQLRPGLLERKCNLRREACAPDLKIVTHGARQKAVDSSMGRESKLNLPL